MAGEEENRMKERMKKRKQREKMKNNPCQHEEYKKRIEKENIKEERRKGNFLRDIPD